MRRSRFGVIAVAVGFGVAMTVPGIAQAAGSGCAWNGNDRACFVNYSNGTSSLEVCDGEEDGHGVYADFQTLMTTSYKRVGDGNGSKAGCGTATWSHPVNSIYFCEEALGHDDCARTGF